MSWIDVIRNGNASTPLYSPNSQAPAPAVAPTSFMSKLSNTLFGEIDPTTGKATSVGVAAPVLSGLASLGNAWLGMKQYGLAKDTLKFEKKAFNQQFAMNKNMVNSELTDRQNARVASNPNAYQDTASYMKQWGVK